MTGLQGAVSELLTNDTFGEGGTLESGKAEVSDLDGAGGAGNEDVVALEVAVDDGWRARVQEVEALQDLMAPALQQLQLHLLKALQIPEKGAAHRQVKHAGETDNAWHGTQRHGHR